MKLGLLDLHDLRRALHRHPEIAQHVPNLGSLDRMRSASLLAPAKKH